MMNKYKDLNFLEAYELAKKNNSKVRFTGIFTVDDSSEHFLNQWCDVDFLENIQTLERGVVEWKPSIDEMLQNAWEVERPSNMEAVKNIRVWLGCDDDGSPFMYPFYHPIKYDDGQWITDNKEYIRLPNQYDAVFPSGELIEYKLIPVESDEKRT